MPHIHDLYDFTVSAFIVFREKVLLVNHPRYQFWLAPGGHIELNENPDEALFREIEEETGFKPEDITVLSTKPKQLPQTTSKFVYTPNFIDVHEANAPHKHITLMYLIKANHNRHLKSDEHSDARWFTASELDKAEYNIPPDAKFAAKEAIEAVRRREQI